MNRLFWEADSDDEDLSSREDLSSSEDEAMNMDAESMESSMEEGEESRDLETLARHGQRSHVSSAGGVGLRGQPSRAPPEASCLEILFENIGENCHLSFPCLLSCIRVCKLWQDTVQKSLQFVRLLSFRPFCNRVKAATVLKILKHMGPCLRVVDLRKCVLIEKEKVKKDRYMDDHPLDDPGSWSPQSDARQDESLPPKLDEADLPYYTYMVVADYNSRHNGERGKLLAFNRAKKSCGVRLANGRELSVRRDHLQLLESAEDDETVADDEYEEDEDKDEEHKEHLKKERPGMLEIMLVIRQSFPGVVEVDVSGCSRTAALQAVAVMTLSLPQFSSQRPSQGKKRPNFEQIPSLLSSGSAPRLVFDFEQIASSMSDDSVMSEDSDIEKKIFMPLHAAAKNGYLNATFIEFCARVSLGNQARDPDYQGRHIDEQDSYGRTPAHYAARGNHTRALQALCNAGARVEITDRHGYNSLMVATQNGCAAAAKLLVGPTAEAGALNHRTHGFGPAEVMNGCDSCGDVVLWRSDDRHDYDPKCRRCLIDRNGRTALMMASMHGMTDVVRMLLEKGADCMMTDGHKNLQALQGAADGCAALLARHMLKHHKHELLLHKIRSGDELAVEMLLNAGADASYKDKDGRDALAHAEDYECRILLKQHIAEQSLHGAARMGRADLVAAHIAKGCDVNARDKDGKTALAVVMDSLARECFDMSQSQPLSDTERVVPCTIDGREEVRLVSSRMEAFDRKLIKGRLKCRAVLAQHMLEGPKEGRDNNSLLLHFATSGDVSHVESILEARANPAFRGRDERTCLVLAIESNNDKTAEVLIAPTAAAEAIDAQDVEGISALMLASAQGQCSVVQRLLEAGAKPQLTDKGGRTSLMLAVEARSEATAEMLLASTRAAGALDVYDVSRTTALMYASSLGLVGVVEKMLSYGANPALTDRKGRTALWLAYEPLVRSRVFCGEERNAFWRAFTGFIGRGTTPDDLIFSRLMGRSNRQFDWEKQQTVSEATVEVLIGPTAQGSAIDAQVLVYESPRSENDNDNDSEGDNENEDRCTLLMMAARGRYNLNMPNLIPKLVSCGADCSLTNRSGCTSLMLALVFQNDTEAEFLIAPTAKAGALDVQAGQGAEVDEDQVLECGYERIGIEGMTALMMASARGLVEIVEKLLQHGANPDVMTPATEYEQAETALTIAQKIPQSQQRLPFSACLPAPASQRLPFQYRTGSSQSDLIEKRMAVVQLLHKYKSLPEKSASKTKKRAPKT